MKKWALAIIAMSIFSILLIREIAHERDAQRLRKALQSEMGIQSTYLILVTDLLLKKDVETVEDLNISDIDDLLDRNKKMSVYFGIPNPVLDANALAVARTKLMEIRASFRSDPSPRKIVLPGDKK